MPSEADVIVKKYHKMGEETDKSQLVEISNMFVKENYGQFAFVLPSSITKDGESAFTISCGISSPYYVYENNRKFPHLRFNVNKNLSSLGLELMDEEITVTGLSMQKLDQKAMIQEGKKRDLIESTILEVAREGFSRIPLIRVSHNQLLKLIRSIDELVRGVIPLDKTEFKKWPKYFELLQNLKIIRIEGDHEISYGQNYKEMERQILNSESRKEDLVDTVFSYVIKYGGPYIANYVRITSIIPYLRSSASYYYFSTAAKRLINVDKKLLHDNYHSLYNKRPVFSSFEGWIEDLCHYGVLNNTDSSIQGVPKIYQSLLSNLDRFEADLSTK